ncbi:hypothetical protein LB553_12900 [Mesorhizobium sp. CA8]|uniref:hypothetical protein n=1 Tax=unclassified Mesorhizobium TaxID=325217 RepID=UPI001CD02255|nr:MULTISPECIES: hypothetical protein [unclassified Mesorhizobium]MBZ9761765.1 hypothetical protein [Mesorhizobium sp. CA8]MBZ9820481.1 hypothetical protein [Mesorhizobium sp. CA4]
MIGNHDQVDLARLSCTQHHIEVGKAIPLWWKVFLEPVDAFYFALVNAPAAIRNLHFSLACRTIRVTANRLKPFLYWLVVFNAYGNPQLAK